MQWPSSYMGDMIIDRLEDHNFEYMYKHIKYENAGHTLNSYMIHSGTLEGNEFAMYDSYSKIFEFLGEM